MKILIFIIFSLWSFCLRAETVCSSSFVYAKPGDTIENIFKENCSAYSEKSIKQTVLKNSLNPSNIQPGQKIFLSVDRVEKKNPAIEKISSVVSPSSSAQFREKMLDLVKDLALSFLLLALFSYLFGFIFIKSYGYFKNIFFYLFEKISSPFRKNKKLSKNKKIKISSLTTKNTELLENTQEKKDQNKESIPFIAKKAPYLLKDEDSIKFYLKKEIIGHEASVNKISRELELHFLSSSQKPLLIMLMGETGVGKTQLAKAIAEALETKLYRFDMSNYASEEDLWRLHGPAHGYVGAKDGGELPNKIREANLNDEPCVLLLDEVEKADQKIYQTLLAFADEGRLTDALGSVESKKGTVIILTSNLPISSAISDSEKVRDEVISLKYFSREFIGRIDLVENLRPLSRAELEVLFERLMISYLATLSFTVKNLSFEIKAFLNEKLYAYYMQGGARGVKIHLRELMGDDILKLRRLYPPQEKIQVEIIHENNSLSIKKV